jgi:hypothetical protein
MLQCRAGFSGGSALGNVGRGGLTPLRSSGGDRQDGLTQQSIDPANTRLQTAADVGRKLECTQAFSSGHLHTRTLANAANEVLQFQHQRFGRWNVNALDQPFLAITQRPLLVLAILRHGAAVNEDTLVEQVSLNVGS